MILKYISNLVHHGPSVWVYPGAYIPWLSTHDIVYTPAIIGRIPYVSAYIKTLDGVHLTCFVLPQTEKSLARDRDVDGADDADDVENEAGVVNGSDRVRVWQPPDDRVDITPAAGRARATIIMFHGNACHASDTLFTAEEMFKSLRCNVVVAEYRGYGVSQGSYASEQGLRKDAQAVLEAVLQDPYLSQTHIVLYGPSLGGAVALDLASRNPHCISSVIVANTWTSLPEVVRSYMVPVLGDLVSFFCSQKWNSAERIKHILPSTPILMMSGRKDNVVSPKLMDDLWKAANSRGSTTRSFWKPWTKNNAAQDVKCSADVFKPVESAGHGDIECPQYWHDIDKFLDCLKDRPIPVREMETKVLSDGPRWRYIEGVLYFMND